MRLRLSTALLVASAFAAQTDTSKLKSVFTAAHDAGTFDGVAVVTSQGKTILAVATGFANREQKLPNKPTTVFRLGSLTKQVTALLVMQEVSRMRIELDQPVGTVLNALPESARHITIRQLLTHFSGLPNPSDGPEDKVPAFYLRTGAPAADMTQSALGFCSGKPKRDPGAQFEYNNCDYIVLGAMLEKLSGKSYAALLRERVIVPLGLKSWVLAPGDPKQAPVTAIGYQENGMPDLFQNPATYGASGGLLGNALDVAKWNEALLNHRLLSAEATETMFRADPKLYGEALGSWAWDAAVTKPPVHVVERQGDIGSTRLLSLLLPSQNASIVIIANTEKADLFNSYSKKGLGYGVLTAWFGKN